MRPDAAGEAGPVRASVVLAAGRRRLSAAGLDSPGSEARTLFGHACGVPTSRLALIDRIEPAAAARFDDLVARRLAGVPVQHLTGRAGFRHIEVEVGPGVFVPRPETEVMTGWAIDRLRELTGPTLVVELCTGSGAIAKAIAAEVPAAEVHAVEISHDAVDFAQRNLAGSGVDLRHGDMADAFADLDGRVDLVIANPPYIPLEAWESVPADVRDHDPHVALFSGDDGLDAMRVVAGTAARLLRSGGLLCAEHAEVQQVAAPRIFVDDGRFAHVRDEVDWNRRPRFVTAVRR